MMNFGLFEDDQHYSSASSDSGVGGVENQKILEKTRKNEGFDLFLFGRYVMDFLESIVEDDLELPANWPDYDFHRKKSCLLSRIFSTCVTKAINHLELVQNAIEDR